MSTLDHVPPALDEILKALSDKGLDCPGPVSERMVREDISVILSKLWEDAYQVGWQAGYNRGGNQ